MATPDATTRCVVLTSDQHDDALAAPVASALAERLWHSLPAGDPLEAFAELCLLDRRTQVDRPWGSEPRADVALVIVEPKAASPPDLEALLASIIRYLPRVSVWAFADGALRRVGEPEPEPAAAPGDDEPPVSQITREEIAMLLDVSESDGEP